MKNNLFTRILEIIWLVIGIISVFTAINSFLHNDSKNGWIMIFCAVIGFLMFFLRRNLRLRRKDQNGA